ASLLPSLPAPTYASLLLQQGESPEYVKRQLGHASIEVTVDTYGKWLPRGNKAAVDRLDDQESGSKLVANGGLQPLEDLRMLEATWRALEEHRVWRIPEMNRRIV